MLNLVQVGITKNNSLSTSKSDNMRSILKIKNPTSHFEDHLRSDVAGAVPTSHFDNHLRLDVSNAVSLITEPELKKTKRDFKRSPESGRRLRIRNNFGERAHYVGDSCDRVCSELKVNQASL